MQATDDRLAKFAHIQNKDRRTYCAMMLAMDENIGKVLQKLAETGQEKNTLVMFIADNGGPNMPSTTTNASINAPLRGSKRTTLEGGIRVPFLLSWKGRIQPGVYDQPVIQLDVTATALELAGVTAGQLDGVNLLPYLAGTVKGAPHEVLYWRFGEQMAIRMGDFKLVRYDANVDTRTGARNQPVAGPKLYNLANDIGEKHDLYATQPEKAKALQAKWDAWNATLIKPLWGAAHMEGSGKKGKKKKSIE